MKQRREYASKADLDGMLGLRSGSGLQCRHCGCRHFETLRTERQDGRVVRRRLCRNCGWRCTTAEEIIGGGKTPLPVAVPEIDDPDWS